MVRESVNAECPVIGGHRAGPARVDVDEPAEVPDDASAHLHPRRGDLAGRGHIHGLREIGHRRAVARADAVQPAGEAVGTVGGAEVDAGDGVLRDLDGLSDTHS